MITVEHLTYEYPGKRALDDISFNIRNGSITALVGPNGAGKTTLLKCLAALTPPFAGRIFIGDTDILKAPRKCHRILGFLPDFFGLYDALTVEQSLTYFALARNMEKGRVAARVREVADAIDLTEKFREKVGSLSRGMRQRLALGQAMIHDPQVLLLDEPASGLDPEARYKLARLFLDLNRSGKTLLVSSHILSELDQYATDLLIIRQGRIVENTLSLSGEQRERRKLCIRLVSAPPDIVEIAGRFEGVSDPEVTDDTLSLIFEGDDEQQHALLKSLVLSGVSVKEFFVRREGVQEQYLDIVR
ncbi:ABC transporter ATP-binding protein [Desulfonema ishimotonii]|uniref:ABC transporter ATP-binding protein n=1 Tax=Desulfonema ishimotonii TaxID=45657 RepID=A0A401G0X5_9BACT|nr:ABC transporter ATP-binding protein [Desulfonema ishimotonii]GBC62860.1 ABC transporter ATP-binding protein [Desulfonema ishimotonii]